MQPSIEAANLLADYVRKLSMAAPPGWTRIVTYKELKRDSDGDLRCVGMGEYWVAGQHFQECPSSAEEYLAMEKYFDHVCTLGEPWSAIRLEIQSTGQFNSDYFYASHPLLDAKYAVAEARLAGKP